HTTIHLLSLVSPPLPPVFPPLSSLSFFFFNATPPPEIYTLSLHDALPIWQYVRRHPDRGLQAQRKAGTGGSQGQEDDHSRRTGGDRKSTRLNSSHVSISYAVFCLKKKKKKIDAHNKVR